VIKKTFHVPDMHCSVCVMKLESLEDLLPGVEQVDASYRKQQMVVRFDETRVSVEQIIEAAKKRGYQAVSKD